MSLAKDKPYYSEPSDYEDDVYLWAFEQAELLRSGRFSELDLPNVIEELEDVGREVRDLIEDGYRNLLAALLEWEVDPASRTRENAKVILDARFKIEEGEKESRSLRDGADRTVESVFPDAVRLTMIVTGLPRERLPVECPYDLAFLRDVNAMPKSDAHDD
ncbi:DUF29 domain-containing protein [Jiella avicenniae]|uniref:DUF29 domain-containing protein n=1 Tax=Jiella avicenniae TaxID=2907202 RepID=A0A9X1T3Z2_9HYPH|nr:DUF29 domain-containing protein [Jiella avicenniae]MCE7026785.1 DUF29 domain-containing protein [Jiella avicenniae]